MIKKVRTKNLKGLIEEHRKEKKIYRTYEFDNDSYMALLCDINSLLHQLEEKEKVIDEAIKQVNKIIIKPTQFFKQLEGSILAPKEEAEKLLEILERGKNGVVN